MSIFGNIGRLGNESELDYDRRMEEYDRIWNEAIEAAAKWHNNIAELETNSLHCGDSSVTIHNAHRIASYHNNSANEIRKLKK